MGKFKILVYGILSRKILLSFESKKDLKHN